MRSVFFLFLLCAVPAETVKPSDYPYCIGETSNTGLRVYHVAFGTIAGAKNLATAGNTKAGIPSSQGPLVFPGVRVSSYYPWIWITSDAAYAYFNKLAGGLGSPSFTSTTWYRYYKYSTVSGLKYFTMVSTSLSECNRFVKFLKSRLPVTCSPISTPLNGYKSTNAVTAGTPVTFSCRPGYRLSGSSYTTCLSTGYWLAYTRPSCIRLRTCSSRSLSNGYSSPSSSSVSSGSRVYYYCNSGYTRVGSSSAVCSDGSWLSSMPVCRRNCPALSAPANGRRSTSSVTPGTTVTFSCNSGYTLSGSSTITCSSTTGRWSGSVPTCRQIIRACSSRHLSNGYSSPSTSTISSGTRVSYYCNSGYSRVGVKSAVCSDGTWSSTMPVCGLNCPSLSTPTNGRKSTSSVTPGTRVTFSCNSGYTLSGSSALTCSSTTGRWSGSVPSCTKQPSITSCPTPSQPSRGYLQGTDYKVGSQVNFYCSSSYYRIGAASATCLSTGKWSASTPRCVPGCPRLVIDNADLSTTSRAPDTSVTVLCHSGYAIVGSHTIKCSPSTSTSSWSAALPKCVPSSCPRLSVNTTRSGVYASGTEGADGTTVSFWCSKNHYVSGQANITCGSNGKWSDTPPSCLPCPEGHKSSGFSQQCENSEPSVGGGDDYTKLIAALVSVVGGCMLCCLIGWCCRKRKYNQHQQQSAQPQPGVLMPTAPPPPYSPTSTKV
eukprot:m.45600 g.45600  ORF g.45600 m.45600 type:complete len:711 (+) comp17425_c0_seq1:207-2339(+)